MENKIGKAYKQVASKVLGCTLASYYNWNTQQRPIISLLEKYFSKEDLEEFLESGAIDRLEPDKKEAAHLVEKLKKHYKVGTSIELADKIGVAQNTISGWIQRNSVGAVKRKIYELGLNIDIDSNKKSSSSSKITELENRVSYLESIILEQNNINDETMAKYANVPLETIQDWKQTKPELIATITQSLIKQGDKQ